MKAGKGRRYMFGLMIFCAIFFPVHTIQAQTAKQANRVQAEQRQGTVQQQQNAGDIQTKEITSYRQEVQALQEEIKVINEQLTVLSRNHRNSLEEFNLVSKKAKGRQRIVRSIENECTRLEKAIDSTNRVIKYQGERLAKYEENYRKLLVNAYKHRDSRLWFMYLLASGDIERTSTNRLRI